MFARVPVLQKCFGVIWGFIFKACGIMSKKNGEKSLICYLYV